MQTGIFTFYVPGTVEESAKRIRAYGFDAVQLNLEFKDWRFQDDSTRAACQAVRETFHGNGLAIAAIAGYLNPIAHDPARRRAVLINRNPRSGPFEHRLAPTWTCGKGV